MTQHSEFNPHPSLSTLLKRADVWRGASVPRARGAHVDTGYPVLNAALAEAGWPQGCLTEVCQQHAEGGCEWQLLLPVLQQVGGYVVLLNPPALPFAQGMIQAGLDLNRVLVVQAQALKAFIQSFVELARTEVCDVLMAWQPRASLSYTQLRKCALACSEGQHLSVLFRPASALKNSSPAALRLWVRWQPEQLQLRVMKQKGTLLKSHEVVSLAVPPLAAPVWDKQDFYTPGRASAQVLSFRTGE